MAALRNAIGETQQQFAQRIGTTVTTVARYETNRPPKGAALEQLSALARSVGKLEIAYVFERESAREFRRQYFGDPIHIEGLLALLSNRGPLWLEAELSSLIADSEPPGTDLSYPDIRTAVGEVDRPAQIAHLNAMLSELERVRKGGQSELALTDEAEQPTLPVSKSKKRQKR